MPQFGFAPVRGCIRVKTKGKCYFCCTPYENIQVMKPINFWKLVGYFSDKYNISYFFETGDDFVIGNHPKRILEMRPKKYDHLQFRLYTNFEAINENTVTTLKNLGVRDVFVGLENINKWSLKTINKMYKSIDNWDSFGEFFEVFDILEKHEINFYLPWISGMAGDNERTVGLNARFVSEMLSRYKHLTKLYAGIIVPAIGTEIFNDLLKNEKIVSEYNAITNNNLLETTNIDYSVLMKRMVEHNCDISFEKMRNMIGDVKRNAESILGAANVADNFGVFDF